MRLKQLPNRITTTQWDSIHIWVVAIADEGRGMDVRSMICLTEMWKQQKLYDRTLEPEYDKVSCNHNVCPGFQGGK